MIEQFTTGFYTKLKLWPTLWVKNTVYAVGAIMKPTTYADHAYKCSVGGISHTTTEPTWSTTNGASTTDGTVTWVTFDPLVYNTLAPQSATLPYITFGILTDTPQGIFGNLSKIESMTFWVNVFSSTSPAHCFQIADLVAALMDNADLTITGYTSMVCMREYAGSLTYDLTNGVYQIPLRYRVMASKT